MAKLLVSAVDYLIAYIAIKKVESRTQFSDMVLDSFYRNCKANVLRWVCGKEEHKDQGHHYHMTIKLDHQKRWLPVRNYSDQKCDIKVRLSHKHSNYNEAWKYVTKENSNYILPEGHPDLVKSAVPTLP